MKLFLNELSLPQLANEEVIQLHIEYLQIVLKNCEENKVDTEQLKLHLNEQFHTSEYGANLFTHLYANYGWEEHALFNSLIDCPSLETEILKHEMSNKPLLKVTTIVAGEEIVGLALKSSVYISNSCLYSLNTDKHWDKHSIVVKAYADAQRYSNKLLINYSTPENIEEVNVLLIKRHLESIGWKPNDNKFPFSSSCTQLEADCRKEIAKTNSAQRIPIYLKFGEQFAVRNGYSFNNDLSKKNTTDEKIRNIYSAGSGRDTRFLCIDVENVGFEYCDFDGTHLGTYGWKGNKIGKAKIYTHSIKL